VKWPAWEVSGRTRVTVRVHRALTPVDALRLAQSIVSVASFAGRREVVLAFRPRKRK